MSNWITDRLPTAEDAPTGRILAMWCGEMVTNTWTSVQSGDPWMPLPAPYVKPKRWTVKWNDQLGFWMLMDNMSMLNTGLNWMQLPALTHQHGKTAEQIEDLFNEAMP